ncbi:unnamed protein product, partial [Callosobruchus maculatus]
CYDTTLIAASQEELVALLNVLEQHSAAYGLGINYNKTKVIIVDREHDNPVWGRVRISPIVYPACRKRRLK